MVTEHGLKPSVYWGLYQKNTLGADGSLLCEIVWYIRKNDRFLEAFSQLNEGLNYGSIKLCFYLYILILMYFYMIIKPSNPILYSKLFLSVAKDLVNH